MNAWINAIAELTGIGHWGADVSLSDLSFLLPDARWLMAVGVVAAFWLVGAYQDAWTDQEENRKSNSNRK